MVVLSEQKPPKHRWWRIGVPILSTVLIAAGPAVADHGFTLALDITEKAGASPAVMAAAEAVRSTVVSLLTMLVGAALLIGGVIMTIRLQSWQDRRLKNASTGVLVFNDRFSAMHDAIADFMASGGDERDAEHYFTRIVEQTATLFGTQGFRVCVYFLETFLPDATDGVAEPDAGTTLYLALKKSSGRAGEPRDAFLPGSAWGDAAIAVAMGREHVIVPDCDATDHPISRNPNSDWHSFFAIPLSENGKPRGMMSVDAREKMAFTDEHIAIARTAGRFLTLGTARTNESAEITQDEATRVVHAVDMLRARNQKQ